MLTIHLTFHDLARFRLQAGPGEDAESAFALHLYGQDGDLDHHRWRRRVRSQLGELAEPVAELAARRTLPELLALAADRSSDPGGSDQAVLRAFASVAVAPFWPEIGGRLKEARKSGGRTVITNGIGRLLDTLHPRLHWRVPTLQFRGGPDRVVHLDGRGVSLSFAYFLPEKGYYLFDGPDVDLPKLVIPLNPTVRGDLCGPEDEDGPELGDLMGHTRAIALQVLTDTLSTGELAAQVGISLAGASKHAAVLRRAGLITTRRSGSAALHRLTPLGAALLEGRRLRGALASFHSARPVARAS